MTAGIQLVNRQEHACGGHCDCPGDLACRPHFYAFACASQRHGLAVGHAVQLGQLDPPPLSVPTVMQPKPMGYGPYPITDQTADLIGVRSWIWRTANIAYAAWPSFVVFRNDSLDMVKQGYALLQS
jgi:hypothetical protein